MTTEEAVTSEDKTLLDEKTTETSKVWTTLFGALFCQGYCAAAVLSAVSVQLLQGSIPDFQLNMMRVSLPTALIIVLAIGRRSLPRIPRDQWRLLALMCFLNSWMPIVYYGALSRIPVGTGAAIDAVGCLLFGLVLYRCFLGENVSCTGVFLVVVCIAGVILILQPYDILSVAALPTSVSNFGMLLKNETSTEFKNLSSYGIQPGVSAVGESLGYVLGFLAGCLHSVIILCNIRMSEALNMNQYMWNVLFWQYILQFLNSLVLFLVFETPVLPQSEQWLYVSLHAIGYCATWPFKLASNARLSGNLFNILANAYLVYLTLCQYTLPSNILPGHENWQEIIGMLLVVFACMLKGVLKCKLGTL